MTGDGAQEHIYRCAPTVTWVKDASQTILVEEEKERSWRLQGVEAIIWDLLTLDYAAGGMIDFLALLLNNSVQEAQTTLLAVLRDWAEMGIVCAGEKSQRG